MQVIYCQLPLNRVKHVRLIASNDAQILVPPQATCVAVAVHSNVRLMRRSKDSDNTRFALSGKLSDVCAALDQLAAQETRNALRWAVQ